MLDGSSRGVIGLPDVSLSESVHPAEGSRITSEKRDVKLPTETELVLRVIAEPREQTDKP